MPELYTLLDLMPINHANKTARKAFRYAIAVALVEQQLRDLKKVRKVMRTMPHWPARSVVDQGGGK